MAYKPRLRIGAVVSVDDPDGSKHYGSVIALLPNGLATVRWERIEGNDLYTKDMTCPRSVLTVLY